MSDVWLAIQWTFHDYISYVVVFLLGGTIGAIGIILTLGPGDKSDR